jgi:hypothetical protein
MTAHSMSHYSEGERRTVSESRDTAHAKLSAEFIDKLKASKGRAMFYWPTANLTVACLGSRSAVCLHHKLTWRAGACPTNSFKIANRKTWIRSPEASAEQLGQLFDTSWR